MSNNLQSNIPVDMIFVFQIIKKTVLSIWHKFPRALTVHSKTPKSNDIYIVGMENAK